MKTLSRLLLLLLAASTARAAIYLGPPTEIGGARYRLASTLNSPAVARSNNGYVVAWSEAFKFKAKVFDRDGRQIRALDIGVGSEGSYIAAASDGTNYLLVRNRHEYPGSALSATLLRPPDYTPVELGFVSRVMAGIFPARVVWSGSSYFVVYAGRHLSRVSANGAVLETDRQFTTRPLENVNIACDGVGTCHLVADNAHSIYDAAGTLLRDDILPRAPSDITWDGRRFLVVRIEFATNEIVLYEIGANGNLIAFNRIPYTGFLGAGAAIASNGSEALIGWTRYDQQSGAVAMTAIVPLAGGPPTAMAEGAAHNVHDPDAIWDGDSFVHVDYNAVTRIRRDGTRERIVIGSLTAPLRDEALITARAGVHAVLYREGESWADRGDGTLRNEPLSLRFAINGTDVLRLPAGKAAVAAGPATFLAVWTNGTTAFATRIRHDGTLLDPSPLPIANSDGSSIHAAWDGANYLVVARWANDVQRVYVSEFGSPSLPQAVVTGSGAVAGATDTSHAIAYQGVATSGLQVEVSSRFAIPSVRFSVGITDTNIPPVIATDGTEYAIFYVTANGLVAQRFDDRGKLIGAPRMIISGAVFNFSAVWNGQNYIVVSRAFNDTSYASVVKRDLTPGGERVPVAPAAATFVTNALARTSTGVVLFVYTENARIIRRSISEWSENARRRTIR